jgi:NAD+ diphosphatase
LQIPAVDHENNIMKLAETVTFGGAGFDRAADRRANACILNEMRTNDVTSFVVLWRGKPLVCDGKLVRLNRDHPVLSAATEGSLFLGLAPDPVFAVDLSEWEPEELDQDALDAFFDPSQQHHPMLPTDHLFCELRGVMTQLSALDAELAATARAVFSWHRSHQFCSACGQQSDLSMGGWQRDCPACNTSHFPRTDPVVIMLITHGNSVLMGRSPGWPDGMYSLLAGFIEPGETIEAAVRRETREEAGIEVGEVTYLASQPWAFPSSLMIGCHGVALTENIEIDPNEIEDAIWVTREDMMDSFAGQVPDMKPARPGSIAHFLLQNWLADRLD